MFRYTCCVLSWERTEPTSSATAARRLNFVERACAYGIFAAVFVERACAYGYLCWQVVANRQLLQPVLLLPFAFQTSGPPLEMRSQMRRMYAQSGCQIAMHALCMAESNAPCLYTRNTCESVLYQGTRSHPARSTPKLHLFKCLRPCARCSSSGSLQVRSRQYAAEYRVSTGIPY